MITEEKIQEVRRLLKKGVPQGELYNGLKNEGYSEEDIKKVFVPHKYDMRSWYLTFAVVFLLIGIPVWLEYGSWLLIIFSAVLFSLYYNEKQKVSRQRSQ